MFCIKCGNPIPEQARFCPSCGTPVYRAEIMPEDSEQSPAQIPLEIPEEVKQNLKEAVAEIMEQPLENVEQTDIESDDLNTDSFYDTEEKLVALLDLITGYKEADDAFIGWFIVDAKMQGQGIGSQIFADIRAALSGLGYDKLRLGCIKENNSKHR